MSSGKTIGSSQCTTVDLKSQGLPDLARSIKKQGEGRKQEGERRDTAAVIT